MKVLLLASYCWRADQYDPIASNPGNGSLNGGRCKTTFNFVSGVRGAGRPTNPKQLLDPEANVPGPRFSPRCCKKPFLA